jgi:hypothetical protein
VRNLKRQQLIDKEYANEGTQIILGSEDFEKASTNMYWWRN